MSVSGSGTEVIVQLRSRHRRKTGLVKTVPMVIDDLLEREVGACGIWQCSVVCLALFSTAATSSFPNFFETQPKHRCHMGEAWETKFLQNGLSFEQIVQLTSGLKTTHNQTLTTLQACRQFDADWEHGPLKILKETELVTLPVTYFTNRTLPCPRGYVYEFSAHQYHGGIVADMNLVCDRRWLIPVGTSYFMIGMSLGYVLGGIWAGRFGRKNALLFFSIVEMVAICLCSRSQTFWDFSFFRLVVAIGTYAKLTTFNLIILEITVPKHRSLFNALINLGFTCFGQMILIALANAFPNWRALNFAASIHCVLALTYFCLVPESPRWLLSQQRTLDAIRILQQGRRINHLHKPGTVPSELLEQLCEQETFGSTVVRINQIDLDLNTYRVLHKPAKSTREQFRLLFSNPVLIRVTIISTMIFFVYGFTSMGLLLSTRKIRQSVFLVSLLNALITIPSTVITTVAYRVSERRRLPLAVVSFVGGTSLLVGGLYVYIVVPKQDWVIILVIEIGLMFYAAIQCLLFIYIMELYPSAVRSQGFGLASGLNGVGSIVATYANELNYSVKPAVPMLLYASVTFAVGLIVLCLPDTNGEEDE